MILKFKIEYRTTWGEELVLVLGEKHVFMKYGDGGIWTARLTVRTPEKALYEPYHYEVWKDGIRTRREWRDRTVAGTRDLGHGRLPQKVEIEDRWSDIPENAPFHTSAFAEGAFSVRQGADGEIWTDAGEMYRRGWKCAGTAVPVFSLRTEESFGIGDFLDLKKMAEWAAATGQRIIQLLPVNDTTATGTWTDSYPYSANSIYALHPQFIRLTDAGVRKDKTYKKLQAELEALPQVDYEKVNELKEKLMRKSFATNWAKTSESVAYRKFYLENKFWLDAYCAYRILTRQTGTADPSKWGKYAKYSARKIEGFIAENREEADYHAFVQFHLSRQLKEARDYAHSLGVILKGDLPIGVSRTSVDAWQNPSQFHLDSQAGAPPDAFAADGQNWGFPTYNWDKMEEDGYAWWKARLKNMEQYFDAFRIDHILGFFRIWEIPAGAKSGLMGHFNPALPFSGEELKQRGFDISTGWYSEDSLNTLFLEDPRRKGFWHPRIAAQNTERYRNLPQWQKDAFNALYDDFFYRRHNIFWRDSAMRKLPDLLASTGMLACGEDLGMIPDCVPDVMKELKILSLEIERMPKDPSREFADTWSYPYFSVCATSTHDMSPLRAWWHEDRDVTRRFWNSILGKYGEAPADCGPDTCRSILMMHLQSASIFCILPLQDYLSIKPELCMEKAEDERINVPAISPYYWRYRMKVTLEALLADDVTADIRKMTRDCGRK